MASIKTRASNRMLCDTSVAFSLPRYSRRALLIVTMVGNISATAVTSFDTIFCDDTVMTVMTVMNYSSRVVSLHTITFLEASKRCLSCFILFQ